MADNNGENKAERKRVRRDPDARRTEIIDAARQLYLDRNYLDVGLAEIASAGEVSRPLLYRYFPAGRSDVFLAVVGNLVDELDARMAQAARTPFSSAQRLEHLLAALFAFFSDHPHAYRVLMMDVWAVRDPQVVEVMDGARSRLTAEIAYAVAADGGAPEEVLLLCTGILGAAFANVGLTLSGAVDAETAWQATCRLAVSQLRSGPTG